MADCWLQEVRDREVALEHEMALGLERREQEARDHAIALEQCAHVRGGHPVKKPQNTQQE